MGGDQTASSPREAATFLHLRLRVAEADFLAAARRLAREEGIFTWARSSPGDTPATRVVELAVGDATLGFAPDEVAAVLRRPVT